jgi:glutaredoxin
MPHRGRAGFARATVSPRFWVRFDVTPSPRSVRRVTLYHAEGCHLCERAREVLASVRSEAPFELEEIDIGGDPELEAQYREWLPVVEIDGERAFVYYVDPAALRRRVEAQS